MPPKKKEEPVEKPVLGRFKSNLKARSASTSLWMGADASIGGQLACLYFHTACMPTALWVQVGIVGLPNVG